MSTTVDALFDLPGPKGLRKNRQLSILSVLVAVILVTLVVIKFGNEGGLDRSKWLVFGNPTTMRLIVGALWATLRVAFVAAAIAFVLGTILTLLRTARSSLLRTIVTGYVEVTRSLPTLLVLYFTILVLPSFGIDMPVYWQVATALVVTNAAMISEILRAGLLAIPRGQTEAAMSLGVTRARALRLVILPQAFKAATPGLIAQLVYLMKGSTLGYVVSYAELLYIGRVIGEYTTDILQSFLVVTAIYLVINLALTRLALFIQAQFAKQGGAKVEIERITE